MQNDFRCDSENSAIAKIEIFAMITIFDMIAKFRYHSEISLLQQKFGYSENFAMIAKISLSLRKFRYAIAKLPIFYAASCILQPAFLIFQLAISSS